MKNPVFRQVFRLKKIQFVIEKPALSPKHRVSQLKNRVSQWKTGFLVKKPSFSNLFDKPGFLIGEKPGISGEKLGLSIKKPCFFRFYWTLTLIYPAHFEDVPCQSGVNHIYEG